MKTLCRYIEKGRRKILLIIHFPKQMLTEIFSQSLSLNYSCIKLRIPEGVNQKLGNGIQLRVMRSQTCPLYTAIFNMSCLLLCTMDYTPFRQYIFKVEQEQYFKTLLEILLNGSERFINTCTEISIVLRTSTVSDVSFERL